MEGDQEQESDAAIRVVKVGGSLFNWPGLCPRLAELLDSQRGEVLLIAGGGPGADLVRRWDRHHRLGPERAHRLAIRALHLGEALLVEGLADAVVVADLPAARAAWSAGRHPILDVEQWLAGERAAGRGGLPASWDVTSDSIAAFVASRIEAELLVVKSTSPAVAGADFVDPAFNDFSAGLFVEWVNLRSGEAGRYGPPSK